MSYQEKKIVTTLATGAAVLAALALGYSPVAMINLMYIVFCAGCIVESAAKMRYCRRSAANG